jgi:anthranilate synthase/aminodeoxychorismate synthase-like glutamine amidotransferase
LPDWLIIDNFDSFTYNLVHLCHQVILKNTGETGNIEVFRPGTINVAEIARKRPKAILISPGPGTPKDATLSMEVVKRFAGEIPLFGVCLGMQVIAECFGAQVVRGTPIHGKKFPTIHDGEHELFTGIPTPFEVVRYHSLQVDPASVGDTAIRPLAWTKDGVIMALECKTIPMVWGVQFHPESIGSEWGQSLLENFYRATLAFQVPVRENSSTVSLASKS